MGHSKSPSKREVYSNIILPQETREISNNIYIHAHTHTCCCSVAMSVSLQPHELQHSRLPCPSLSPRICSNSCPLSQWCHPNITSSVTPFSSCLQPFPASGSLLMSRLFAPGGQSIGASSSASVLPMNIQVRFTLGWTSLISLLSKGLSGVSPTAQFQSISSSVLSLLYDPTLTFIHDYWKTIWTIWTFVGKVISLLFNTLFRFVIASFQRASVF